MSSDKNTEGEAVVIDAKSEEVVVEEEEKTEDAKKVTKLLKNCPLDSVVLYSDRAELTHVVEHEFEEPGLYDVCIEGLPQQAESKTLRVSGGMGNATLLEVSTSGRSDPDADTKNLPDEIKAKKEEVERIRAELSDLEVQASALDASIKWLNSWSQDVANTPPSQAKGASDGGVPFLSKEYIANVRNFTEFYAQEQERLDTEDANLREQMEKKKLELRRATEELNLKTQKLGHRHFVLIAVVSLQVTKAGKAAFHLVYRCRGCTWTSKYDCRVDEKKMVQLTYFGSVTNKTGFDWVNTRLTLSTAEPAAGGEPPELTTAKVSLVPEAPAPKAKSRRFGKSAIPNDICMCCEGTMVVVPEAVSPMNVVVAEARHGMTSCSFDIPRRATIESDGVAHKVTIAIVPNIEASLDYLLLPRLHDAVYMKAICKNPCDFCFLPGPASVFVEGSFVATSPMEYTAPGQEFSFFIGPDKDLRVNYKLPTAVADKTGIVFKNNLDNFVGEIRVKNNKDAEVSMTIQDQLPRSTSSQVTVTLVEPSIPQTPGVTIDDDRNLITWKKTVSPGQTEVFPIRFTVEYPKDKKVNYSW